MVTTAKGEAVSAIADAVVHDLLNVRHWGDSSFVNLPIAYASGTFVTVKLDRVRKGVRVSDGGFAYRELESLGAERSFHRTAASAAESEGLSVSARSIFVDVPRECLVRAICDVSIATWSVVDNVYARVTEQEEYDIENMLCERLVAVFGDRHVSAAPKIVGSSSSEWKMSAVVDADDHKAVFHAVGDHANSVYRTKAAFHDLGALDDPPILVAVVHDCKALGPKLGLLAQAGRVIEGGQPDDVYRRAAA